VSDPRKAFPRNITWAPNHNGRKETRDLTLDPEWGNGEHVYLCIQVSDTGVGMSQSEIKKLFTRFEQAGSKTSIKYGGSGLGLFISHRLTEKQGGEIGVASVPSEGSTFAVYVKARRVELERVPQTTGLRSRSNSKPCSIPDGFDLDKMHVLLVEDNIVNQKVLRKQLTKAGCIVHVANHGVEALEFLSLTDVWHEALPETAHLDIILMDWEMPVMDGLSCTREIRSLQRAGKIVRHIQIIGTTANARDEQIETAIACGIVSH
jgi:CheY-like chemotaxis protein